MFKLIFLLCVSYIGWSNACSCWLPQGWEVQAYCNAGFAGIIRADGPAYNCGPMRNCYPITTLLHLRGSPLMSPTVLETASQSAACGIYLEPGHIYLIATEPVNVNRISQGLCGLTRDWTDLTCCQMIAKASEFDCTTRWPPILEPQPELTAA